MATDEIKATGDAASLAALISRAAGDSGGRKKGLPPVDRSGRADHAAARDCATGRPR